MKRLLTLPAICLLICQLQAQDLVFSQFFAAPLELNPALTGITYAPRVIINYRNQWPAIPNAYTTYAVSYDQYFDNVNSGFGVNILADQEGGGIYKTNRIDFSYAYDLQIEDGMYLRGGLEAGFVQKRLDWDKLLFLDQIDPLTGAVDGLGNGLPTEEIQPENLSRYYGDFSAGVLFYSPTFYAGAALKHINAPDENLLPTPTDFAQRPLLYSVHAGAEIRLTESNKTSNKTFISPNVIFVRQADLGQVNVGAYFRTWYLFGGAWYRYAFSNPDAAIFLVGFQKDVLKIGYSYDLTLSPISHQTAGGHEISLILNFDESERMKKRRQSRDFNNCLKLFK